VNKSCIVRRTDQGRISCFVSFLFFCSTLALHRPGEALGFRQRACPQGSCCREIRVHGFSLVLEHKGTKQTKKNPTPFSSVGSGPIAGTSSFGSNARCKFASVCPKFKL
jgi:hypothetical protein